MANVCSVTARAAERLPVLSTDTSEPCWGRMTWKSGVQPRPDRPANFGRRSNRIQFTLVLAQGAETRSAHRVKDLLGDGEAEGVKGAGALVLS